MMILKTWLTIFSLMTGAFSSMAMAAASTEWDLWLPPGGAPVRAVFICPRWGDGANMAKLIQDNLGEKLGIATLLTRDDVMTFKEDHFFSSIPATLNASAVSHNHPELANAPLLLWAHSNAAQFLLRCLKEIPERVVAYCLFKSAFGHNNDFGTMSMAAKEAFGQSIWDQNDRIASPGYDQETERLAMFRNVSAARRQGALIHVTLVRGTHHVIDGQQALMLKFFTDAMDMRVPANADAAKGPVKLIGGFEKKGMIQDWKSKFVFAYADGALGSDRREGWWLPTREYAVMWKDYARNEKGVVVEAGKRMTPSGGAADTPSKR
ncbi:MAG: hypothetical protein O3C57_02880 [Verrucomicrobia bacterium]|nr:hypothetical protein [Verrucomicrobiota bacterium]